MIASGSRSSVNHSCKCDSWRFFFQAEDGIRDAKTVHRANFSPPTTIASDTRSTVTAESGVGTRRPPIRYKKPPRLGITLGQGQRSADMFGSPTTMLDIQQDSGS